MASLFLSNDYVVLALIKAKYQIFYENFVTTTELNQFTVFMQQEFNAREFGVVIISELSRENFNVKNDIITVTDECCIDLDILPDKLMDVLTNESLILEFFIKIETRRLEILNNHLKTAEVSTSKKLSHVLQKSNDKGI